MKNNDGRPGGLPMNEAVPSSPAVGIPDARLMHMQWHTDAGYVRFEFPSNMSQQDADDVCGLFELTMRGIRRRAQGIEAGTVETERLDAQHENPVACDAPTACSEEAAMISEQMKAEGAGNVVRFAKKCRFCEDRHQVWQLCGLLPEVGAPHRLAYKPKGHHP